MSQVKKHIRIIASLAFAALFALNCARNSQTPFAKNMAADAGKPAPTYEEWVALVGQAKADQLYAGVGQDSLNLLSYGIGQSNMVQLINGITVGSKLVTLIGNDSIAGTGPGTAAGLGAVVTIYLLKSVDAQMQVNLSTNLVGGGAVPTDQDTITNLVNVINGLSAVEIQQKLIELFGPSGFDLSRSLATATSLSAANQQLVVDRMARVVAHVDNTVATCTKICTLLTSLANTDITGATGKLKEMMKYNLGAGMTLANKLVETIETTTNIANLVTVIQGVTYANTTGKMMPIIDTVNDCTKMGYVINNVTSLTTLINLINNVQVPVNMGNLINMAENASTWVGQVSPAETWGVPVKAAPFATAPTAATITGNVAAGALTSINVTGAGANYLPGITLTFPGCTTQPTVHLAVASGAVTVGVSSASGPHYVVSGGAGCTNGAAQPATIVTAGTTTAMARLVATINGLAPATTYYKLLNMVDGVSDMTKMVRLIQDVNTVGDIYDLVNNMTGVVGATCTVANGTDTVSIVGGGGAGAAATAFIVSNQVAYIRVSAQGAGYTSQPTITIPGCTAVTFSAVGPVPVTGAPITQIGANGNPMNNLTQVVELMSLANMTRLQQVVDGQRAFDNTNQALQTNASLTTTYLGKLRVLMQNLSQPLEGTVKVGDLLNGVTLPDKIIDLIWGVTTTTNLSTVINGIFKASEVPGCSDGSAGTYSGVPGAGNTTAVDTGTCEASGNGYFYGERDRAVTTLVYLVENVASSAKLISMIDNITPANVIALVNHTATYSQHADGTAHVYPRGAVGIDAQAAGKRLAKIVDNTTTITQLNFVANNVSAIIKMAKLVAFMDIGVSATTGTGKLPILINAVAGANAYLSTTVPGRGNPTGNATGMGKMVNVIEFISGATTSAAMVQLKNLLNDVTDINKMADLINQTVNSSNIVGLLNGVTDPRYGTSTTDLVTLMNNLPRGEISKLVSLVGEIGNAAGTATATFPGQDHVLIAQLMSAYNAANIGTTSGVGVSNMSALMGTLNVSGGTGYTAAAAVGGLGGGGATATSIVSANLGAITKVTLTNEGVCTVAPTAVTAVAGGGAGATFTVVTAPTAASATNFKVKAVYINDGGSGYANNASALTFNGTCSTAPVASTQVNGIIGVSVTAGGTYTDSFGGVTFAGGGAGATATALVAGPINTLASFYGGAGYTTGDICPIRGAGGSGGTCTVTAAGGAVTACSAIGAGTGYIDGQIVSIGGAATVQSTVAAGSLTAMTVTNSGCGYVAAPTVTVLTGANECGTAGAYVAVLTAGRVTSITVTTAATGCPANPTVVIGETPYTVHGDGATAIVNNVTAGAVVAISLSSAADNLAQLLTNTEKAPGAKAINYNGTTTPNVSAREGMVRMLHHGVNHTSAGYLTANGGAFGVVNNVDYPGVGSVHIAQNVLNNLSSAGSVMTVVNLLNSDSTSLTDMVVMIGCGDHVEYARTAPLTSNDFHFFCSGHAPTLW